MKKLIIAIAAFGLLTGCTHFNPAELHNAYQKTKDSYAFAKDAYKQIKSDYVVVRDDIRNTGREVRDELRAAGREIKDEFNSFKESKTLDNWLDANQAK